MAIILKEGVQALAGSMVDMPNNNMPTINPIELIPGNFVSKAPSNQIDVKDFIPQIPQKVETPGEVNSNIQGNTQGKTNKVTNNNNNTQPKANKVEPNKQNQLNMLSQNVKSGNVQAGDALQFQQTAQLTKEGIEATQSLLTAIDQRAKDGKDFTADEIEGFVDRISKMKGIEYQKQGILNTVNRTMSDNGMGGIIGDNNVASDRRLAINKLSMLSGDKIASMMKNKKLTTEQQKILQGLPNYQEAIDTLDKQKKDNLYNSMLGGELSLEDNKLKTKDIKEDLGLSDNLPKDVFQKLQSLKGDSKLSLLSTNISGLDSEIYQTQKELKNMKRTIEKEFPTSLSKSAIDAITYDRSVSLNEKLQSKIMEREMKVGDYDRTRQELERELESELKKQEQTMSLLNTNNGLALFSTSASELKTMEEQGRLPEGYSDIYKNYMEGMVVNTMSGLGTLTYNDMNNISGLIDKGLTPQQIIGAFQDTGRFTTTMSDANISKVVKVGQKAFQWNPNTNKYDIPVGQGVFDAQEAMSKKGDFSMYNSMNDYTGNFGADYPGLAKQPVPAPVSGVIEKVEDTKGPSGITVTFRGDDGKKYFIEHNNEVSLDTLKAGMRLDVGQPFSFIGNTGYVKTQTSPNKWVDIRDKEGNVLRPDLLHRGNHASITIYDEDGKKKSVKDTNDYIQEKIQRSKNNVFDIAPADIRYFNALTPTALASEKDNPEFREFERLRNKIFNDEDASIDEILYLTRGGKPLSETAKQGLAKVDQAFTSIKDLQETLKKQTTGPIRGTLREANLWDSEAQGLKAQLNSLIPNLARGVYSEVGVLTDNDIALYKKTVPNLRATADTNDLILSMTLRTVANGYKNQLQTQARGSSDVAGFEGAYNRLIRESDKILADITQQPTQQPAQEQIQNAETFEQWLSQ